MTRLELLSPAKNLACGIAAIDHGADAVYIGAQRFGARAAAGNSIQDIHTLCDYAHQFDAKVYVTVNTIIYDEELDDTIRLVKELDNIGVDAILIQDMGLFSAIRDMNLHCELHASTQTDNRTPEKVQWLFAQGFDRVVLARELSINEIRAIHDTIHNSIPLVRGERQGREASLEVFVHGALCVSYSGQCYASQACFGRSANRGECAQFCRMQFDLVDADGNIILKDKHMLSLKDMAQIDNLEKLADAGAVSFKIEGRLKDVDYVKNITAAYSERLNDICQRHPDRYQRASMGRCTYSFTPDIHKSFNRNFTSYFANGRKQELANFDTPKAMGEYVGKVKEIKGNSFNVASTSAFSNGDGLCFLDKGELIGFRVNRAEGNRLFLNSRDSEILKSIRPATMLYRNHDQAFESLLSKPSSVRKVFVTMSLHVTSSSLELTMVDEHKNEYKSSMPYSYQQAQKPQQENIRRQLTKLGDTVFECSMVNIETEVESPFIPSSLLAELRRRLKKIGINQNMGLVLRRQRSSDSTHRAGCYQHPLKPLFAPFTKKIWNKVPIYQENYLYNATNNAAKEFYKEQGVEATGFERNKENQLEIGNTIMQCRYCIRHELGHCSKYTDHLPWKEPLRLILGDGREFELRFNCAKCQMEIIK